MGAPRIESLTVKNFKSVGSPGVTIQFPAEGALVVLGENNAGKSNISRAMELILGERWPKSYQPDDHDFFGRSSDGIDMKIGARFSGVDCKCGGSVSYIRWLYDKSREGDPCDFTYSCDGRCNNDSWVNNKIREQLYCMFVGADRRLSYQLSYASKYTFLSKLMHGFHNRLMMQDARVARLRNVFDQIVTEFENVEEFATFRELLRGTAKEFGQNLSYELDIDFSAYDPSNFFRSLRLHPNLDGDVRSFDELGTGQEQILALAFAYSYARAFGSDAGLVLAIDEPESNLHPMAQQWLAQRLHELSTEGLQVVVTTHSPHFVDLSQPENLVIVRKRDVMIGSRTVQTSKHDLANELISMGAHRERTTAETVGSFYSTAATSDIKTGLFSAACVLVEGDTERYALPPLLKHVGCDLLRDGIAVIPVGGVGNLAKWYRLFTILEIPSYVIMDSDSDKTDKTKAERERDRKDILTALSEDPNLANELSGSPLYVGDSFSAFDSNFESAASLMFHRWDELCEEAREVVGDSKPLQARFAAERIHVPEISDTSRNLLATLAASISVKAGIGMSSGTGGEPADPEYDADEIPF